MDFSDSFLLRYISFGVIVTRVFAVDHGDFGDWELPS